MERYQRGRMNLVEFSTDKSFPTEGEIEEFTLIEGVLMDENQNETKDMFLTLFLLQNFIVLWHVVLSSMPKREIVQ